MAKIGSRTGIGLKIIHFFRFLIYVLVEYWNRVSRWIISRLIHGKNYHDDSLSVVEQRIAAAGNSVQGDPMVIEAQSCLFLIGFPMGKAGPNRNGVDGIVGPITRAALTAFQKLARIGGSGGLDLTTVTALKKCFSQGLTFRDLAWEAFQATVKLEITRDATMAEFVNAIYYYAVIDERQTKVPAAVTTAQAILESNYGSQVPVDLITGKYSYNLFGLKGQGPAGSVTCWTREENPATGQWTRVVAWFQAFNSFTESIEGHSRVLIDNPRYHNAFQTTDPSLFAMEIAKVGYATDSHYAAKLIQIMTDWDLK